METLSMADAVKKHVAPPKPRMDRKTVYFYPNRGSGKYLWVYENFISNGSRNTLSESIEDFRKWKLGELTPEQVDAIPVVILDEYIRDVFAA